jgi:hypothetical protein
MLKNALIVIVCAMVIVSAGWAVACPANSHETSSGTCVCDSGYVASGGQCVPR